MPSDCNHLTFLEGRVHNLEKKLEEEKKKEGREGEKSVWMSTPGVNTCKGRRGQGGSRALDTFPINLEEEDQDGTLYF